MGTLNCVAQLFLPVIGLSVIVNNSPHGSLECQGGDRLKLRFLGVGFGAWALGVFGIKVWTLVFVRSTL